MVIDIHILVFNSVLSSCIYIYICMYVCKCIIVSVCLLLTWLTVRLFFFFSVSFATAPGVGEFIASRTCHFTRLRLREASSLGVSKRVKSYMTIKLWSDILAIGHARWSRLLLRLSTLPAGLGLKSVWLGCAARYNAASICSRRALWFWAAFGPGCLSWSIFSHLLSFSVPACWVTLRLSPFQAI